MSHYLLGIAIFIAGYAVGSIFITIGVKYEELQKESTK